MKVDFRIGTKSNASFFTAKFLYIGRWNDDCNTICFSLVKAMEDTFKISAQESKITNEQMTAARKVSETDPIHVWLDVTPIKDTFPCRVTFRPQEYEGSSVRQIKQAYSFANCLCEYVKEYASVSREGKHVKKFGRIQLQRDMPNWEENNK